MPHTLTAPVSIQSFSDKSKRPVILWLVTGVVMVMIQILLGGITRLTGSGLSITEWKPLLGALPPLNEHAWQHSFEQYQQIAQFKKINYNFTLADYKAIFFWEWLHREWARLMGVVFLIPFLIFIAQKRLDKQMIKPMLILFILGGLQGAIGWLMVKSGLNDTDIAVSHVRLAIHFMCALILLGYLVWFTLKLAIPAQRIALAPTAQKLNLLLLALLFFQLIYGAFMAGTHAALHAPTWPDINGSFIPDGMNVRAQSLLHTLCYNVFTIQFIHRMLAYAIGIVTVAWFIQSGKAVRSTLLYKFRSVPLLLVAVQITLGVMALLNSLFKTGVYYAVIHQFTGMLLLTALLITFYLSNRRSTFI
ncbi:COX15/CtaA family protein [Mucilaginibacter sp. Bleaf8]|uniref:COX15/CtaA family protein n=1 Tax=Mucilaginibacter sp. Bleaf8 TaxID=2834430 RepID=UPI001BCF8464|nr:COX15/CtaA family protein [Mucilaginibacter sp. Bleaf8]MBS7564144.1 COX15/CtaA family protein [Mucilaginibacter sp. Bleaf8]